jgi:hypothetical protein
VILMVAHAVISLVMSLVAPRFQEYGLEEGRAERRESRSMSTKDGPSRSHPTTRTWSSHKNETTANTSNRIFVYLAYDKTGSSSMLSMLAKRQQAYGWPSYGRRYNHPCIHHHKRLDNPESDGNGCFSVPSGDVVVQYCSGRQCPRTDFCNVVGRPCRIFTLLRHPLARLQSAYSYFCLSCEEHGRQCRGYQDPVHLVCPNMTLVEYARYFGSFYLGPLTSMRYHASCSAWREADQFLAETFVLLTELDLTRNRPYEGLGLWLDDEWVRAQIRHVNNIHPHHNAQQVPPELHHILRADIWLYERALKRRLGILYDETAHPAGCTL